MIEFKICLATKILASSLDDIVFCVLAEGFVRQNTRQQNLSNSTMSGGNIVGFTCY